MKSSFEFVIGGIICALMMVFGWQIYWLTALYNNVEQETTREIMLCIEDADQAELVYRLEQLQNSNKENKDSSISIQKTINGSSKTIAIQSNGKDTLIVDPALDQILFDQVLTALRTELHKVADSVLSPNLNILDSLINVNMVKRGINTTMHFTNIVDLHTNEILKTSRTSIPNQKNTQVFLYKYNPDGRYAYQIYTSSLTKRILTRMLGILMTTALMIVILGFAFWYLIQTVMRQKNLDEMKNDFINNMTHELKTPIAVAYSANDALLHFGQNYPTEKRTKYLLICKEQLAKINQFVEQILNISKEQEPILNISNVSLKELIDDLMDQHRLKSDKLISFVVQIAPGMVVKADRTHISNIVSNLIDNAIRYTPSDKVEVIIEGRETLSESLIIVKDCGMGINADQQSYIFDKFYRVPTGNIHNIKGYGLGLFYVKRLVEKHHGSISVQSTPNKGSQFTIQIPK